MVNQCVCTAPDRQRAKAVIQTSEHYNNSNNKRVEAECHFQTALVQMVFFLIPSPGVSELSLLNCLPILLRADGVKRDKGNISVQFPCISSPPDAIIDMHFTAPQLLPSVGRIIKRLSILGLNVNNQ